jgi:tRNA (adenine57-N1/adenine58-N1)-methyltransferase
VIFGLIDVGLFKKFKRGPQVILLKDASLIAGFTGLGFGGKIVDVGAGSGFLAIFLGNLVGEKGFVHSYERRAEFADLSRKNVAKAGLQDIVEIVEKDAFEGIEEKDVDLVTLDCADSEKLLAHAFGALREGGWCVGYTPNVEQLKEFVFEGERVGFKHERSLECAVREWLVREQGCRPETKGLTHTGFLCFLRKS